MGSLNFLSRSSNVLLIIRQNLKHWLPWIIKLHPALAIKLHPALAIKLHPALAIKLHPALAIKLHPALAIKLHPALAIKLHPALAIKGCNHCCKMEVFGARPFLNKYIKKKFLPFLSSCSLLVSCLLNAMVYSCFVLLLFVQGLDHLSCLETLNLYPKNVIIVGLLLLLVCCCWCVVVGLLYSLDLQLFSYYNNISSLKELFRLSYNTKLKVLHGLNYLQYPLYQGVS